MPAWRNGRRSRLKIYRGRPRAGSSPAAGIETLEFMCVHRFEGFFVQKMADYECDSIGIEMKFRVFSKCVHAR